MVEADRVHSTPRTNTELANELKREVELAPATAYVVTVRRELLTRIEAALRFAINPTEEYIDRVANAIIEATAPLIDDLAVARDAAIAALEAIAS